MWSWGSGDYGRLGHGDNEEISEPKLIETLCHNEIKQVSSYDYFVACVTTSGEVYFWGNLSQIGLSNASTPRLIQRQNRVHQVACGFDHALILQDDGVYAIGQNSKGECGLGDTVRRAEFTKVDELDDKDVVKIACSWKCSAALTRSGQVYVWGWALCGIQKEPTTRPMLMQLDAVIDISMDSRHILALDRQNRVYGWGQNDYGECGVNSGSNWINTPTHLPNMNGFRVLQIVAGYWNSFIKYQ